MSDEQPGFPAPPPPPPGAPPPVYQPPPGYAPTPAYQTSAGYVPYQQAAPAYQQPVPAYQQPAQYSSGWNAGAPQPYVAAAAAAGGTAVLLNQFGGAALASIACGVASIVVPFVSGFYFPVLPIAGALNGWRAMQRGRFLGGLVGIGVNLLGGLVSLFASGIIGPH